MAHALRKAGRPTGAPAGSGDDGDHEEMLDDTYVEKILDSNPETTATPATLDAAIGIRNGLAASALFWAVLAIAYLLMR